MASIYFVLINFFECIYERIQYVKCTCFLLSKKFSIRIDNKGKKSPPLVPAGLEPTNPKQILPQSLSSQALFPTTAYNITAHCSKLYTNISSVVEFQRWWVLKSKLFGQESTCHQGKIFKKILRVMTVCQKLGVILESKVVQKLSLEKKKFLINNGLLHWNS